MASLQRIKRKGKSDTFRIWIGSEPDRKSIRLGELNRDQAERVLYQVKKLESAKEIGEGPDKSSRNWLSKIDDSFHSKLVSIGLCPERVKTNLLEFWSSFIENLDVTDGTRKRIKSAYKLAEKNLGNLPLRSITEASIRDYLKTLRSKYSKAYVSKTAKELRRILRYALKLELIDRDPFEGVSLGNEINADRQRFISREMIDLVIEEATDTEFKLIIALSRFGGLRIPSELVNLKWEDVNWEKDLILVTDAKRDTVRQVPIFPELKTYLNLAWDESEEGDVFLVKRYRDKNANLRTRLQKTITRAGLTPWPRLWQNLRSSRETELADRFPIHVVTAWIGNTPTIAAKHYLQVTEDHIDKAVQRVEKNAEMRGANMVQNSRRGAK